MNKRSELIGACLFLVLIAVPAQAGLGDLLGPIVNPPPLESGGLGELVSQVVAPVTETVYVVVAPVTELVTETVEVATGTVIDPVVEVVGEAIETTIGTVENTTEILIDETVRRELPPVETPPILTIDVGDLPETKPTFSPVPTEPTERPSAILSGPTVSVPPAVATEVVRGPAPMVRALLTSLATTPEIQEASVLVESDLSPQTVGRVDSSWLSSLSTWLGAGISGLLDVLSIPMRLLELLFRALTSSGAGLLAPASLLLSLAAGGRRRPLTVI